MNPHVHIQFYERMDDGIKRDRLHYFKRENKNRTCERRVCEGQKLASNQTRKEKGGESSKRLLEIRQAWEVICNHLLRKKRYWPLFTLISGNYSAHYLFSLYHP